jgi:sugar phosphate isomerase/epimerase
MLRFVSRSVVLGLALGFFAVCSQPSPAAPPATDWPFFAFDNGVGRGKWTPDQQADTMKELGYDGIHYNFTNPKDFAAKQAACKAKGVPIVAVYFYTYINKEPSYDPAIKEMIQMLKGTDTIVWLTLMREKKNPPATNELDAGVAIVRDISAQARASGVKVSLYPHAGFYVATAEDAVRVVKAAQCDNVGVTVNLCHELFAGNGDRMDEVLKAAAPHMNLASINGASPIPGKEPKGWETLPLGEGSYDVLGYLKKLRATGYRGPVGHQFFAVKGEDKDKLTKAITAWKSYKPQVVGK